MDIKFSLKGKQIKNFKDKLLNVEKLIGKKKFVRKKNELENLKFRRSIYSIKKIKKGEKFSKENIKCIRPASGLNPKYFFKLLGKKSKKTIKEGMPLNKSFF